MPRKPKPKAKKRLFLQIEVRPEHQQLFRRAAKARGLKVATWARTMLLDRATADTLKLESERRMGVVVERRTGL